MTSLDTPTIDFLAQTFDPEWQEEALRIEEECGDFAIGRFGNNYNYFQNSLTGNPALADRIEAFQAIVLAQLEADPKIEDARAFANKHFARNRCPEVQAIFESALESEEREVMETKARAAIALVQSHSR